MYKPRDYQEACHNDIMSAITKKNPKPVLGVLPTGCHTLGYKVIMSDGTLKEVENVKVGDLLMGADSSPRTVLNLCRGFGKIYRVTLNKTNIFFDVNEDHILYLERTNTGKDSEEKYYPKVVNVSVKEYLQWSKSRKHLYKLTRKGFKIPHTTNESSLDPYLFGLWLGDGNKDSLSITTADQEIVDYIYNYSISSNLKVKKSSKPGSKASSYRLSPLEENKGRGKNIIINHLRRLNVLENKHIPLEIFNSDDSVKLNVLKGLIDSDGYYNGRGNYYIIQKIERLAKDIFNLAGGLGLNPVIREKLKSCGNCKNTEKRKYFEVSFTSSDKITPLLSRKRENGEVKRKVNPSRYGFKLEYIGEDDFYGFTLDGDNLYIDENFIVQHNSGKSYSIARVAHEYDAKTLVLCPTQEILEQNYLKFISFGGEAGIYSASLGSKAISKTTYATIGSVKKMGEVFKNFGVSMLIIDESHLGTDPSAGMFKTFVDELDPKYMLGYTATPFRLKSYSEPFGTTYSQLNMLNRTRPRFFSDIAHVTQVSHLVNNNYWAKINVHQEHFDPTGLLLNSTGKDYLETSLLNVNEKNNVNNRIYLLLKQLVYDGTPSILVFLDSVKNCYTMQKALSKFTKAAVVEGETKKGERKKIIEGFKSGDIRVVICDTTLTVGFDFPELSTVVFGRPTQSLAIFYQVYGRLVRPYQDKIGNFYDFGGNIARFGFPEKLVIENFADYGWGVFSGDLLLSGKPMGGPDVTKESLLSMNKVSEFRNSSKRFFEFGEHKGKFPSDIPKQYLEWACLKAKRSMSENLYNECKKILAT